MKLFLLKALNFLSAFVIYNCKEKVKLKTL